MFREYPALIHRDPGSDYGVSFPDFPGCISAGRTMEEAREMAKEALQLHVEGMQEEGMEIPAPSTLDEAEAKLEETGARVVITVPVQLLGQSKRINITLDSNLIYEVDRATKIVGLSRSGFIALACRNELLREREGALLPRTTP